MLRHVRRPVCHRVQEGFSSQLLCAPGAKPTQLAQCCTAYSGHADGFCSLIPQASGATCVHAGLTLCLHRRSQRPPHTIPGKLGSFWCRFITSTLRHLSFRLEHRVVNWLPCPPEVTPVTRSSCLRRACRDPWLALTAAVHCGLSYTGGVCDRPDTPLFGAPSTLPQPTPQTTLSPSLAVVHSTCGLHRRHTDHTAVRHANAAWLAAQLANKQSEMQLPASWPTCL